MNEKLPMTADGLAKLKSELENLRILKDLT